MYGIPNKLNTIVHDFLAIGQCRVNGPQTSHYICTYNTNIAQTGVFAVDYIHYLNFPPMLQFTKRKQL